MGLLGIRQACGIDGAGAHEGCLVFQLVVELFAVALTTSRATDIISGPIPSPGRTAIFSFISCYFWFHTVYIFFNDIQQFYCGFDGGFCLVGVKADGFQRPSAVFPMDGGLHKGVGVSAWRNVDGVVRQSRELAPALPRYILRRAFIKASYCPSPTELSIYCLPLISILRWLWVAGLW